MRKLWILPLLTSLISLSAYAELDNLVSYTFDGAGNSISSTSNALNTFITNSTLACTQSGTFTVTFPSVSTASLTQVSNSASSFTIVASNASRKGLIIYNNSTTNCSIALAATASSSSFSFQITPSSTYVMTAPVYQGAVSGICTSATGAQQVTEL